MVGESLARSLPVVGILVLVVLSGCLFLGASGNDHSGGGSDSMTVEIVAVEDGDTYWFKNESGDRVGIRLIGVDTPEIKGKNYPEEYEGIPDSEVGREYLYEWGLRVRNETRDRLLGETVRLEFDPNLPRRDYYDRLVAYVYHDGSLVNRDLLQQGYARVYPVSFAKEAQFRETQAEAQAADRGVWNFTAAP